MNPIIKIFIACIFLLNTLSGIAQTKAPTVYEEGYILLPDNTKRTGYIGVTGPLLRAEKVFFKEKNSDAPTTYTPDQLKAYSSPAIGTFRSGKVSLRGTEDQQTFFFEALSQGEIILLRLNHQFRDDTAPFLQNEDVYYFLLLEGQPIRAITRDLYRSEIPDILGPCPAKFEKGKGYSYSKRGLLRFISDYNEQCLEQDMEILVPLEEEVSKLRIRAFGGYTNSLIEPSPTLFAYENYEWSPGSGFLIGVGADFSLKRTVLFVQ